MDESVLLNGDITPQLLPPPPRTPPLPPPPRTPPLPFLSGGHELECPEEMPSSSTLSEYYRVVSQTVRISCMDFAERAFRVRTEISVVCLSAAMAPVVVLRLGRDCLLPNEPGFDFMPPSGEEELDESGNSTFGQVTVNDIPAKYLRNKFTLPFGEDHEEKSLVEVIKGFRTVCAEYPGDLVVEVPEEVVEFFQHAVIRVSVDVLVLRPKKGVRFYVSPSSNESFSNHTNGNAGRAGEEKSGVGDKTQDQQGKAGAAPSIKAFPTDDHVFTYLSGLDSSTSEWLPCIDMPDQLAIWRFEFCIKRHLTAICCGDLMDTIPSSESDSLRTFHYQLLTPTSARHIGFAVGPFEVVQLPDMPEVIGFTLPQLTTLLKHTIGPLSRVFNFFEELLSCRFPFGTYRLLFLDEVPDDVIPYAGFSLHSLSLLYHKKVLDPVQVARQKIAFAVAQQFFGCFLSTKFSECWLTRGLALYITGLFIERTFGTSEYLFQLRKTMRAVCDYEIRFGALVTGPHPSSSGEGDESERPQHFDMAHPETCSPIYLEAISKKSHLLMRMLERRVGPRDQFLKVLQRLISVAWHHSQDLEHPGLWPGHMLLTEDGFLQLLRAITGKEVSTFFEQCLHQGGHFQIHAQHTYNRKRNVVEIEIRQEDPAPQGRLVFVGPLTVIVQELEGAFTHVVQVGQDRDRTVTRADLPCQTKGKRPKRKRVQLANGDDAEVELAEANADSPVLWVRIDPDQSLFLSQHLTQHVQQWEYAMRYDRDVVGQFQAIEQLHNFPLPQVQAALMDTVQNDKFYYRVRREAAFCLVDVCNRLPEALFQGPSGFPQHPLIVYFQRQFCCKTAPELPAPNNFVVTPTRLQEYFLAQSFATAIAGIRVQSGRDCPPYAFQFLLRLLKYNDNTVNRYSDSFYRAALISALARTVVPASGVHRAPAHDEHFCSTATGNDVLCPDTMSPSAKAVLEEDTMRPSFGRVVAIHCLQALVTLQRAGHIPLDTTLFWKFGQSRSVYTQLRKAAYACLVQLVHRNRHSMFTATVPRLLFDVLQVSGEEAPLANGDDNSGNDHAYSPAIRYALAAHLATKPPFSAGTDPHQSRIYHTNTERLVSVLWASIVNPDTEDRIRCHLLDLWWLLYRSGMPIVLMDEILGSRTPID